MLNSYFENLREGASGWYRFKDKATGRLDTHSVNFDYKLVYSHLEAEKIPIVQYVADSEACTRQEALSLLGLTWQDYYFNSIAAFKKINKLSNIELPEYFRPILEGNCILAKRARAYLKSRHIQLDSADLLGIGYTYAGPDMGRIVIPITVDAKCIGYTQRTYIGSKLRYKAKGQLGYCFYNQDALKIYKEIDLTEGIFDAIAAGPKALGRNRLAATSDQLNILLSSDAKRFNIICDSGFELKTGLSFMPLLRKKEVFIAAMPKGFKDMSLLRDRTKLNFTAITYNNIYTWFK